MRLTCCLNLVGPLGRAEQTVTLTNLDPGNHYSIRAISTNTAGNSSFSHFIQVQTTPPSGHHGIRLLAASQQDELPSPRASIVQLEKPLEKASEPEASVALDADIEEDTDSEDTVGTLKHKLDCLRQQRDEAERQVIAEVEDAEASRASLTEERDELRLRSEEKDKTLSDFRKQVNDLEKQSKNAQRNKSTKERSLRKKRSERQKMKDDLARWEKEKVDLRAGTEAFRKEKRDLEAAHQEKIAEARKLIEDVNSQSSLLDMQVKDWGMKINALAEEQRKGHKDEGREEQHERHYEDEDPNRDGKILELQARYAELWKLNAKVYMDIRIGNWTSGS